MIPASTSIKSLKLENRDLHLDPFAFTYNLKSSEFISGSSDYLIKFLPFSSSVARESLEVSSQISIILYSSPNYIFFNQENNLQMSRLNDENLFSSKDSVLLTSFNSPIKQVIFNSKQGLVIAYSEDDDLHIVNISTMKEYKYKTTNEVSGKYILNSTDETLLGAAGCDGVLSVYEYNPTDIGLISLKHKIVGCFPKTTLENKEQTNSFDINSKKICCLSGDIFIKVIDFNSVDLKVKSEDSISHQDSISIVKWIGDEFLLTCDKKNTIKFWDFTYKNGITEYEPGSQFVSPILNMDVIYDAEHSNERFCLVFGTDNGSLNISEQISIDYFKQIKAEESKKFDALINTMLNEDKSGEVKKNEGEKKDKDNSIELNLSDIEDENGEGRNQEEIEKMKVEKKEEELAHGYKEGVNNIKSIRDQLQICELQDPFVPSATSEENELPKYLLCNMTGRVISRKENKFGYVDVIFSDTVNKKNISFIDTNEYYLAAMNDVGLLLGNKFEEINGDEYEKDHRRTESQIEFKSIQASTSSLIRDWVYKFPTEEYPILLGIGADWCCAYTSMSYLRIFSIFGEEKMKISVSSNLITLATFDNYLAYVYHTSLPFSNSQQLRLKILDSNALFSEVYEGEFPITNESNLLWFGFSKEGYLVSYDTFNILRAFFIGVTTNWIPVLDLGEKYAGKNTNFWVIGVEDEEVYGIEMKNDQVQPPAYPRPLIKQFSIIENNSINYFLIKYHEKRSDLYRIIKSARFAKYPEYHYTEYLKDENDIRKLKKDHDKNVGRQGNEDVIKGDINKAIISFEFLFLVKSKTIAIEICKEYNQSELATYLYMKLQILQTQNDQVNRKHYELPQQRQRDLSDAKNGGDYTNGNSNIKSNNNLIAENEIDDLANSAINGESYQAMKEEIKGNVVDIIGKDSKVNQNEISTERDENKKMKLNPFLSGTTNTSNNNQEKGNDIFSDLSKLDIRTSNIDNNLNKSATKVGTKRKYNDIPKIQGKFDKEIKKMKK